MDLLTDKTASMSFFPGFRRLDVTVDDVRFAGVVGGNGAPLLLLHGYPQTHIAWRKIAHDLARSWTLIIPDLPGYGASQIGTTKPRWTKQRVARSLTALMQHLGYQKFAVVGHDRGARSGFRLALDYPDLVTAFSSLAVVPVLDAMSAVDHQFAARNFHWFFLSQPAGLPEKLLAAAPDAFIEHSLATMANGLDNIEPQALAIYREAFRNPKVRHAICEDYRAAMNEDMDLDRIDRTSGKKLLCPVQVLWPTSDPRNTAKTPIEIWSQWANDVTGMTIHAGHLLPEESPQAVIAALRSFLPIRV